MMRDPVEQLLTIQEIIPRIEQYTNSGRQAFDENELIQSWIIHHLEMIGEVALSIPQNFKDAHPEIPWKQINDMCYALIHQYFAIDYDAVWEMVEHDLPNLKQNIEAILSSLLLQGTEEGENAD